MIIKRIRHAMGRLRWHIRKQPIVAATAYMAPNAWHAITHRQIVEDVECSAASHGRVALCLRFRDEARFLEEWLEYYLAAGVEHFFLYNNFSSDNYRTVLEPYQECGRVTLIEWPYKPASPWAEHDCLYRARGQFEWVGFVDADEFVVVQDGRSIPEFLSGFDDAPGVALHWYFFGSNGHKSRPREWVIRAYTRRAAEPNDHFKVFVRPDKVTRNRNSHNFYYFRARCAVREDGSIVYGSLADPPTAEQAWINHYYCKSMEDYLEKASRHSTLDRSGIRDPSRKATQVYAALDAANDVIDTSAIDYFEARCSRSAKSSSAKTL